VRVVSLLPSATEALFALGLGHHVVAVTHECDFPEEVRALPQVTRSRLSLEGLDSGAIEHEVAAAATRGDSLYDVDLSLMRDLGPDIVVGQDVCEVCAVPANRLLKDLGGARVILQHPHSLDDVLADIDELAQACGGDASELLASLRQRIDRAAQEAKTMPPIRGVFLEWVTPPYPAGHWTPDLLHIAGIEDPLARSGVPSVATTWEAVANARPELLVMAPCGFDEARARQEAGLAQSQIAATGAAHVAVLDGNALFNRPGPRLVDSLEALLETRRAALASTC
jgi:iron complex transport system substrate-binding protein